jgi:lactate permease
MWRQTYSPIADHLGLSALAAALPLFVLLYLLGVKRTASWVAGVSGLGAAVAVALVLYKMPVAMVASASALGAAFGLLPITWIVF